MQFPMSLRCRAFAFAAISAVFLATSAAVAEFAELDEPVPTHRLIRNLEQHIRANPNDAEALYALGRVHSLAYAQIAFDAQPTERTPAGHVRVIPAAERPRAEDEAQKKIPTFAPYTTVQVGRGQGPAPVRSEAARDHLLLSLNYYRQAVQSDPEAALYHLGHGWMLEQAALFFDEEADNASGPATRASTGPATGPTTVTASGMPVSRPSTYQARAMAAYRQVLELKLEAELEEEFFLDKGPDTVLSREAARGVLRLLAADEVQPEERGEIQRMQEAIAQLEAKPMAVTPIIFSLEPVAAFDDLLQPGLTSDFDLAGDGIDRTWPWVGPETALLVWDPEQTGVVTSGRQLFGSVTWWMFWDTGYDALAMLDDDRDGQLRGAELAGMAAWFDRNGNGRSDPGEVVPLGRVGVVGIRTDAVAGARSDVAAWHRQGLELKDGRVLATWDWRPRARGVPDSGGRNPGISPIEGLHNAR